MTARRGEFLHRSHRRHGADICASYLAFVTDGTVVTDGMAERDGPREVRMRTLLHVIVDAARRLAGPGALDNAAHEVAQASRTVFELDAQLGRLLEPPPRRAA